MDGEAPRDAQHHDVLVTTPAPDKKLYRFKVNKLTGEYTEPPVQVDARGSSAEARLGERKVWGIAQQDSGSGIAFATMPVKDEPASSAISCYLINRELLNYTTVWTRAPWNDHPEEKDLAELRFVQAQTRQTVDPSPRFLLALSTGEVLDIQVTDQGQRSPAIQAEKLDLKRNPDVWRLLRNGCVTGVAVHADGTRLPLFSVASVHTVAFEQRSTQDTELTGTYDFKWRPGSTLKVRFAPHELTGFGATTRAHAMRSIQQLAQQWVQDANLALRFLDLEAGAPAFDLMVDEYDLLISLEVLNDDSQPVIAGGDEIDPARRVRFPISQLGSYAERSERGRPTMYLGWPRGIKERGEVLARERYFGSDTFKHIVLHEFGHALGLAHLHQHPALDGQPFRDQSDDSLRARITSELGVTVDADYVREELKGRWPGATYSEWPAYEPGVLEKWLSESVMFGLPSRIATSGGPLTTLGAVDRAWIRQLYPTA